MRIVVLDGHTLNPGDNPWTGLEALGETVVFDRTPAQMVVDRARGADILLTNKTRLPAPTLDLLPGLRFISVLATGFDVVDIVAARSRGVLVSNVPEYGTDSVAQHVFALVLALSQGIREHDAAVHSGRWADGPDFSFWLRPPLELSGLTMGILGYGRIGRRVGDLAQCFGMRVIACGSGPPPAALSGSVAWRSAAEIFRESDVVTLHCPLSGATERIVNEHHLSMMKPTAFLINTARGRLVDEAALARALGDGRLAGAGVDVVSREPISNENPLLKAPNCLITPHLAWASLAARRRLMATTVGNVEAFLRGAPVNVVNA